MHMFLALDIKASTGCLPGFKFLVSLLLKAAIISFFYNMQYQCLNSINFLSLLFLRSLYSFEKYSPYIEHWKVTKVANSWPWVKSFSEFRYQIKSYCIFLAPGKIKCLSWEKILAVRGETKISCIMLQMILYY